MKKYILVNIILLLSMVTQAQKITSIEGVIDNCIGYKYIRLLDINNNVLDSTSITENGIFNLTTQITETNFYVLSLDNPNSLLLVLKPGDAIKFKADMVDFQKPQISGSTDSELFYKTIDDMRVYHEKMAKYREEQEEKIAQYELEIEKEKDAYLLNFMEHNYQSLIALTVISELDKNKHPELFEKVMKSLKERYPKNEIVEKFYAENQIAEETSPIEVGLIAPDIVQTSPEGKQIALSSLKGKIVLIDFWASWCGPCLTEAPHLVEVYNKYKKKGFEIYGVSLDKNKTNWKAAIEKYNLNWIHVSDMQGWNNAASRAYGVQGIPFTVLLDTDGKIIAKGLRSSELETKLAELLK